MTAEPRLEYPTRVGRYVITRRLGSGGMGDVYTARVYAAAGVEKDVCIKRIRRERLERVDAVDRFIAEARLAVRLNHGNIVQVFDFGRAGDEYYLAMEWVDGVDLRQLLAHSRASASALPMHVVAHVAASIARALAYAHSLSTGGRPVIHCDVKPSNVLISRSGEVKLTDFGAAAMAGDDIRGGTQGYLAPEQRRGGVADARVDLYALGVLLVEASTGELPSSPRYDASRIAPELVDVAKRLLSEDPDRRASDATEIAEALETIVSKERARGAVAPASELARRVVEAASVLDAESPSPMVTDASFARDGDDGDEFRSRMTGTTTPPESADAVAADGSPEPRRPTAASRAWAIGALLLLGAAMGTFALSRRSPRAPEADLRGRDRRVPRVVEPGVAQARVDAAIAPEYAVDASAPLPSERAAAVVHRAAVEPATLDLHATPWAMVFIDGRSLGESPLFGVSVSPGAHRIVFENRALGARSEVRVHVEPGEHRRVVVPLVAAEPTP